MAICSTRSDDGLSISKLTAAEREQVLYEFNDTAVAYPRGRLLHELFEEQVQRVPDAVSLIYEEQSLTYAGLNGRANQLARHLRASGVGPEQLVGLCVEPGVEMVVGLLGILKAGGAYVPLDPRYPSERLAYMLRDAGPRILLTQERLRDSLPPIADEVIQLDSGWNKIAQQGQANLDSSSLQLSSRNLAYVIYTSGSTGEPKGVTAEHFSVVNRIAAQQTVGAFSADDICCQKTSIGFVDSVFEILSPLSYGRPLVIAFEAAARDVLQLASLIEREHVTRLVTVPSLAQSLLEGVQSPQTLQSLRGWTLSGEELRAELLRELRQRLPKCTFINLYGSSEVAADVTCYVSKGAEPAEVPIGRPISNAQIYVLDGSLEPVPIGVKGEIYIGGMGIARGYLNRPELTAERFIADPFCCDADGRLFRSGDLGRWRADGMIEYLGRADNQVKIRGNRIEPGEIETQLARCAAVKEAVVVAREDIPGEKRLVAYITRHERDPTIEELRAHVKVVLPEYMVPSAFVMLDRFPLTPNGKLDRRALPVPELRAYVSRQYEAPEGEVEQTLARIWQEVLHVERVGRRDNFFELGGHSLLIVHMMNRLHRVGLSVAVGSVYESPTLADLAHALTHESIQQVEIPPNRIPVGCELITPQMLALVELNEAHIERIALSVPGGARNIQDIYPLTPSQEGMLFHHLLDRKSGDTYVLLMLLSVSSRERVEELITALQGVIDRHDALRAAVLWEQLPLPVQVIHRQATLPVEEVACDGNRNFAEQIEDWLKPDQQRMDLRQAPLVKLQVANDAHSGHWYALLQVHHIVDDDTSLKILISEILAHLKGCAEELPEPMPYRNHVGEVLAHARRRDAEAFFRGKWGDVEEPSAPFDLLDVHGGSRQIEEAFDKLELTLAERVHAQARRLSVSAATLLHAAWAVVVSRTSNRDDVVFGTVLSGRLQGSAGAQQTLGMFINTLPLRVRLQKTTVSELVLQTQRELAELLNHEQASLAVAQRCSGVAGAAPLFSAVLNYRRDGIDPEIEWASAGGVSVLAVKARTHYPITLAVDDGVRGITLTAQTDSRLNPHRVLQYTSEAIKSLVTALEQAPHTSALSLSILPEGERHQIIELFNTGQATYQQGKLIHELFEEQVQRRPDAIAMVYEGQLLTYTELNSRANQLARHLRDRGVGADQLVAIYIERSLDMIVGLLGVLKAGGAYVPLDPNYPIERLQYMLRDAAPKVLLTVERLRHVLTSTSDVISLDSDRSEIGRQPSDNLDTKALGLSSCCLAYVIYTSGSTGNPKGVMVEHRSVTRLLAATETWFDFNDRDVWSLFHSFAFDFSVWELWGALLYGGRVVLVPYLTARSPQEFYHLLCKEGVTVLNQTPSAFAQLIRAQGESPERHSLRLVVFGGEALELYTLRPWVERNGAERPQLVNMYGITETTVHVTYRPLTEVEIESERGSLIGRPIPDLKTYLLDHHGEPVPIGVTGEIYVGGDGVARGYLNRPELTAERFISDPFTADPQSRMYKTGDLGRWLADGAIEYLGRNDDQVKIRGFRIELGEIEAQLVRHAQVKEAVVVAREDIPGEKRLVAYIVWRESAPSIEDLRAHVSTALPGYMVPSAFVILDSMPLTPSGKRNRRALPMPELGAYVSRQYMAPQGEIEQTLARIWQELLQVERVGRRDNFFELGGHSIVATQVIVRVRSKLSIEMPIRALFEFPTIEELSSYVRHERLTHSVEHGAELMEDLLEKVASMPESKVKELVRQLRMESSL